MTINIKELKQLARKLSDAIDALDTAAPPPVHDPNAFKIGDWVRIVRKVEKAEGWDNIWIKGMDRALEGPLEVRGTSSKGVLLGSGRYPSCALELAAPPFPTVVWTRKANSEIWNGPYVSTGCLDVSGWIRTYPHLSVPCKYWTTTEPEQCRRERLGPEAAK